MYDIYVLVGPTATGKSEVASKLKKMENFELVSLDSMAVYKWMDIGTAKPPDRKEYHLIDVVKPNEPFNLGKYLERAHDTVEKICEKKKLPLFVGGTPLYLKGLTEGIFEGPSTNWKIRNKILKDFDEQGNEYMFRKLQKVDPVTARNVHPNDVKRITRALEVYEIIGKPISSFQNQFGKPNPKYNPVIAGLRLNRKELYARIDKRVDDFIRRGLVEEVKKILENKGGFGKESSQAVGYKEIIGYLNGEYDLDEAVRLIKRNTRRFAKHQLTWFKRFKNIHWIDTDEYSALKELALNVYAYFRKFTGESMKKP